MQETHGKFDNRDRDRVIDAIQKHYAVKLQQVGRRPKWLRDASGRNWWVLGGSQNRRQEHWHGVPEEMMKDERRAQVEGVLVIADKKSTRIDVFEGPLGGLASASDELPLPRATQPPRDYKFNVKVRGTRMRCIEVPSVVSDWVLTIPYSAEERERDRALNEFRKTVAAMSLEDRAALMDELHRIADAAPQGY